jgi:uracil-DNA glycosylase
VLSDLDHLFSRIRACTLCADQLPNPPKPVVRGSEQARILIVGQAPGRRVHETGIPFNDPSGDRLREWMGISRDTFYDETRIALLPMGFCYPGSGKSGDLPPRPECAATWRAPLMQALPNIQLTLLVGQYAIAWHLYRGRKRPPTLTETVRNWRSYWPSALPMPHPSPRNNLWLRRNPWFEQEVVPQLKKRTASLLKDPTPDGP